jgi:hypothetical protein
MLLSNEVQMSRPLHVIVIVLALGMGGRSLAQETRLLSPNPQPLLPILQVLNSAGLSASLERSGVCDSESFPQFPQVDEQSGDSTLATLREMLSSNRGPQVTQDSNGIIRVVEPDVPTDLLKVRISHITFGDGIYSASDALLWVVMNAPEVRAFFQRNHIAGPLPMTIVSGGIGKPPSDSPHISGTLENVTVEEALDRILLSFPGIWLYENCPQNEKHKRTVFLGFYRLGYRRARDYRVLGTVEFVKK